MRIIRIKGIYTDLGKIRLENDKTISIEDLTGNTMLSIPFGTEVEMSILFEEKDFLSGKDGIVWATYDLRQAEIIQNTLFAQNIGSEFRNVTLGNRKIFLLMVLNESDISDATEFIWKGSSGLRLKPDWSYPAGEKNRSFEQWLNEH